MNAAIPFFWFSAFLIMAIAAEAAAKPPEVSGTQPKNGDQEVPTSVREVVVEFDQDMDTTGFSFVGGGPTFPKVAGKPGWKDKRTCVLPVELAAGQDYSIGINSATHTNFRSVAGEPARPITLKFRAAGSGAPSTASGGNANAESFKQLQDAIQNRYSYREVHRVDWPAAYAAHQGRLLAAKTPREFATIAGEMLAATKDRHIWLMEGGQIVPAFQSRLTPNANWPQLPLLVRDWKQLHPTVYSGKAADGVGYLAIHSWDKKHQPQAVEAALQALDGLKDLPAMILDVRFNSGGDELSARRVAGSFIAEKVFYAKHVMLDASNASGFSAPMERWLEPTPGRPTYKGKVVVLMGGANMSSAEAFLLMMKQVPGCKLVGERSVGASGNPQPHALANGVTVYLPSWKAMLPDGTEFETKGIAPDVEVKAGSEAFEKSDPVLETAVKLLRK